MKGPAVAPCQSLRVSSPAARPAMLKDVGADLSTGPAVASRRLHRYHSMVVCTDRQTEELPGGELEAQGSESRGPSESVTAPARRRERGQTERVCTGGIR